MQIRSYQPGDELPQTRIFNTAAAALPGFKPAKPEEVARRIHAGDFDPHAMFYATENGEVVGYAVFGSRLVRSLLRAAGLVSGLLTPAFVLKRRLTSAALSYSKVSGFFDDRGETPWKRGRSFSGSPAQSVARRAFTHSTASLSGLKSAGTSIT